MSLHNIYGLRHLPDTYSQCCHDIGTLYPLPAHVNGLVANLILFHSDETTNLFERERVANLFQEAISLVHSGKGTSINDVTQI